MGLGMKSNAFCVLWGEGRTNQNDELLLDKKKTLCGSSGKDKVRFITKSITLLQESHKEV